MWTSKQGYSLLVYYYFVAKVHLSAKMYTLESKILKMANLALELVELGLNNKKNDLKGRS